MKIFQLVDSNHETDNGDYVSRRLFATREAAVAHVNKRIEELKQYNPDLVQGQWDVTSGESERDVEFEFLVLWENADASQDPDDGCYHYFNLFETEVE